MEGSKPRPFLTRHFRYSILASLFCGGMAASTARAQAAGGGMTGWASPIAPNYNPGVQQATTLTAPLPGTTDHLRGLVISSLTGKPVARVLVTSLGNQGLAVLTDFEGRFAFDLRRPLPQGNTSVSLAGSADTATTLQFNLRRPGYVGGPATATVPTYTPSDPEPEIVLKITPAALITGHIAVDSGGLPTPLNIQIRRRQITDGRASYMTAAIVQPDPAGDFRFPDLVPGDYKLFTLPVTQGVSRSPREERPASARGIVPAFYPEAATLDAAPPIHLHAGETAVANLNLRSATFYRVTVPLASAEPPTGLSVTLPDGPGYSLQYDRREGAIDGMLPSGTYTLRLSSVGNPSPARFPGAPLAPAAVPLINERRAASLTLHVEGHAVRTDPVGLNPVADVPIIIHRDFTAQDSPPADSPVPPLNLNLISADANSFGSSTSSQPAPNGELRLANVLEGAYHVRANPTASSTYVAALTCAGVDLLREPLVVGAGGASAPIEVTLRNDAATLRVSLADNALANQSSPVSPVAIFAIPLDTPERDAFTTIHLLNPPSYLSTYLSGSLGLFSNLPPGRYLALAIQTVGPPMQQLEYRNPSVLDSLIPEGAIVTLAPGEKSEIRVPILPSPENN